MKFNPDAIEGRQRVAFIKLMEECAEVQQVCSKALLHGIDDVHPETQISNKQMLEAELGHVFEWVQRLVAYDQINIKNIALAKLEKAAFLSNLSGMMDLNVPASCARCHHGQPKNTPSLTCTCRTPGFPARLLRRFASAESAVPVVYILPTLCGHYAPDHFKQGGA